MSDQFQCCHSVISVKYIVESSTTHLLRRIHLLVCDFAMNVCRGYNGIIFLKILD